MKTVSIHLTQEPEPGLFRVVRFTNTIQLSVGMIVKAEKVGEWCAIPRVNVHVDGMTATSSEDTKNLLTDGQSEQVRHNALGMEGCA